MLYMVVFFLFAFCANGELCLIVCEIRFSKLVDDRKPGVQMARILQYLECPQYLRKSFFPQHKDLEYAGLLTEAF